MWNGTNKLELDAISTPGTELLAVLFLLLVLADLHAASTPVLKQAPAASPAQLHRWMTVTPPIPHRDLIGFAQASYA